MKTYYSFKNYTYDTNGKFDINFVINFREWGLSVVFNSSYEHYSMSFRIACFSLVWYISKELGL